MRPGAIERRAFQRGHVGFDYFAFSVESFVALIPGASTGSGRPSNFR
jgi:hypothetical protein